MKSSIGAGMDWDTAAGDAVLRGAGGEVVRFEGIAIRASETHLCPST